MGANQAKETNNSESDEYEEVKVPNESVINQWKQEAKDIPSFVLRIYKQLNLERKLSIAARLDMIKYKIELKNGSWSLHKILSYLNKLKNSIKCEYSDRCEEEVCFCNEENGDVVCQKHYMMLIHNDADLKSNYQF